MLPTRRSLRFAGLAAALSLACFLFAPSLLEAQVVINEIFPNPFGDDVGTERIEIYNAGSTPVDMTGWAIDDAATFDQTEVRARIPEDFDTALCPGSAVIGPGEFRVIMGQSDQPFLNNSGDDIYLISDRNAVPPTVVHLVSYGQSIQGLSWAAVPDGSSNFDWRATSLCGTNGGGGDVTPPATVSDLAASPGDYPGEVRLTWTAPGDDGATGTASEYRIRVSHAAINGGNFDAAADLECWINEPLPAAGGSPEEWTVFGLDPDSTYYFALITIDDASNESGVSNSPSTLPRAGNLPDPDLGYTAYFGNLHSHTSYSDGVQTPADAYTFARYTSPTPLDFLAVTDHNHLSAGMSLPSYAQGLSQAAAANSDGNFVAIYGQEWGLASHGHVIVLEAPTLFGWDPGNYDVYVAEGDYAGLYTAALAHPPAGYPPIGLFCHPGASDFDNLQLTANGKALMHLMCLVNGPANSTATDESDIGNTNFDAVFQQALYEGYRVSPTADQDNHYATWGASSQSRTGVLAAAKTKGAIFDALSARRNYATQDHNARVDFTADGHAMGDAFSAGAGIRIAALVTDPDPGDAVTMVELFRGVTGSTSATLIAYSTNNPRFDWREQDSFAPGTEAHYYLRIRTAANRTIWTGPVYVTYDPQVPTAVGPPAATGFTRLLPPFPNPLAGSSTLGFDLARASDVRLEVFDLSGRRIAQLAEGFFQPGRYTFRWNGHDQHGAPAGSGLYFVRFSGTGLPPQSARLAIVR